MELTFTIMRSLRSDLICCELPVARLPRTSVEASMEDPPPSKMSEKIALPDRPQGIGARHVQALLTFFSMVIIYSMRANLSVAIVAMTTSGDYSTNFKILPWTLSEQGIILSSFFWGYMVLQMPAGELSRRFGPKYLLFGAMLVCSMTTLISPVIALHCHWTVFCTTRIVNGLSQGFFYPSVNTHLSKWAPPLERSRMFSFVFVGTQLGIVLINFSAGYLAASAWGWPSIFYTTGLAGLLWAVVWLFLGADSPDTHPRINSKEREYIKASLVGTSDNSNKIKTPWKDIWTSKPLWALLICHLGQNWGYWMLLTMLPSYLKHVFKFDIKSNGVISALPYLVQIIFSILFSWISDFIVQRNILPVSVTRKMWNTIAHWGGAIALVCVGFISSSTGVVILLTTALSLNAGVFIGFLCNHLDLSPNFAGFLMGITNGFANITSILGPLVTGFIVQNEDSKEQWELAFYLAAAIFFLGNLIFIIFGSTKVQPWNEPKEQKT